MSNKKSRTIIKEAGVIFTVVMLLFSTALIVSADDIRNDPPGTPDQPEGPTEGLTGVEYCYSTNEVVDPDGDDVFYLFDWGNYENSGWLQEPTACHMWYIGGYYDVKVKAKDTNGDESPWSEPLGVAIRQPGVPGYQVKVVNSTTYPGATEHEVEITGEWQEELRSYVIGLNYGPLQADGDMIVTDVTLDGCVSEDPYFFNAQIFDYDDHGFIKIFVVYTMSNTPGDGIPAGGGKLAKIIVTIAETAGDQEIFFTENYSTPCVFHTINNDAFVAEFVAGNVHIIDNQPPETPDKPTGETEGTVGVEYCYTANEVTDPEGDEVFYLFDWDDGTDSGWLEEPTACQTWTQAGTYDVKVKAKDSSDVSSDWSGHLRVTIATPELVIESITGFIGVSVVINNTADVAVSNVNVTFTVTGGFLGGINFTTTKTVDSIAAKETVTVRSGIVTFLGFGPVEITVVMTADGGISEDEDVDGFQVLFLTLIPS